MDGGLILNVKSPEDEYDVLQELSLGQVIGVMDQLLCFEVRPAARQRLRKESPSYKMILIVDVLACRFPTFSDSVCLTLYRSSVVAATNQSGGG